MKNIAMKLATLGLLGSVVCAPMTANASIFDRLTHRQNTKNTWRNATIGSAALGILGLATHNDTLTAIGAIGTVYSGYRYDQDRKSEEHITDYTHRRDDRQDNRRDDHRAPVRNNRNDNRNRR